MPIRSLLFAPAARPDLLRKLPRAGADLVVADLEDGVAENAAEEARRNAAALLAELAAEGARALVRVNEVGSRAFDADLEALADADAWGVVLPKCEDPAVVAEGIARIAEAGGGGSPPLILGLESFRGVAAAAELAALDPSVLAVYFGAEDFITSVGGRRTREGREVLYARSQVLLAARVAGVGALDQAIADVRDGEFFKRDAMVGRELGYDGKLCIHPDQVAIANSVFAPTEEEIRAAEELVRRFEEAAAEGDGAPVIDGRMIDGPLVKRARDVLARAGREVEVG